jgi:uncharacterized protein
MSLPHIDLLYSLSGLAVGFLVGLTGVGGGSLMTPILVLLFGVHPATAVGTDLLYAAATKSAGTLVHGIKGSVDWRVTLRLATGSVPAATLTLILLHRYGMDTPRTGHLIQAVLGAALLITAIALFFRPQLAAFASRHRHGPGEARTLFFTILTGAVLGALVSLTSVGAGAIGVTVLLPLTLLAGAGHWLLGSINWPMLLSLLCGSLPGIVIGSMLSSRAPEKLLRVLLAATLTLVGARLVLA